MLAEVLYGLVLFRFQTSQEDVLIFPSTCISSLLPRWCTEMSTHGKYMPPGFSACFGFYNNNNVHLSCAHQRPECSHDRIHINLHMIFYTHVEHSPPKTIYIKYYVVYFFFSFLILLCPLREIQVVLPG